MAGGGFHMPLRWLVVLKLKTPNTVAIVTELLPCRLWLRSGPDLAPAHSSPHLAGISAAVILGQQPSLQNLLGTKMSCGSK